VSDVKTFAGYALEHLQRAHDEGECGRTLQCAEQLRQAIEWAEAAIRSMPIKIDDKSGRFVFDHSQLKLSTCGCEECKE
jgi:hypothetical protein